MYFIMTSPIKNIYKAKSKKKKSSEKQPEPSSLAISKNKLLSMILYLK